MLLVLAALAIAVLASASAASADTLAKVTQQPANAAVEAGAPASFTSTASATPTPTVQWEVSTNGAATWNPIPGATSTTYSIAKTVASENGYEFRAVFTNGAGPVASKPATLTVTEKPAVTQQPVDAFAGEGKEATFTSTASGSPAPTIQWMESTDGGATYKNLSGATTNTLKLSGLSKSMDGWKFHAVFKNSTGTVTSEAATLHILNPPHIEQQPLNTTVTEGEAAAFHSTATGNPTPTVQWELSTNGGASFAPIEGATNEFLTVPATTPSESGYRYRAIWTNLGGTVTSSVATLTVVGVPKVTLQPLNAITLAGGTVSFTAEATGSPAPTVQWEVSSNGGATFTPIGGATGTTLTISNAQVSESGRQFRAVFKNTAGTTPSEAALLTVASTDYRAYGWGNNKNGQAGVDSGLSEVLTPTPMPGLEFVTQVAQGSRHGLALRADGTVASWGANAHGQLGNAGATATGKPEPIEHLSGVTEIAAGDSHSLALLSNGTVVAWGDNEQGQLGNGKSTDSEVPVAVQGLTNVTAIAAGEEHSLALLSDGTVMAWGKNEEGELGNGKTNASNTPVAVNNLSGVTAIAAGGDFSLALLSNGTVVAWGSDVRDELGNEGVLLEETESEREAEGGIFSPEPVPVDGLTNVKAISAGLNHGLALLQDGTMMSWGDDSAGELGNGAIEERNDKASPIPGLSGVSKISAGEKVSAAVLSNGTVMTWGSNELGDLGIGEAGPPSDAPVQAHNIVGVAGVAAGSGVLAYGEAGPVVTKLTPNEGPATGGGTVTITGTNLGGASAVHFGTASATSFTVDSPGSITATAPAGTGSVHVSVTTPSGTSAPTSGTTYIYRTPPTVTHLSVKGGPATGGTAVTITGTEFGSATGVTFAGVPAASFKIVNAFTIEAVSPPGIGGPADVRVSTVGGPSPTTKKDQFRYAPVIEGVSPANGPEAGGNTVTITGVGFIVGTGTVKFKFGRSASKSVQCSSSTTCTVLVPAGRALGTVDVLATANKGKSTAVPADHYTYE